MLQTAESDTEHSLETHSAVVLSNSLEKPSNEELFDLSLGARVGIAMLDYGASWWGNRFQKIDESELKRWLDTGSFAEMMKIIDQWRLVEVKKYPGDAYYRKSVSYSFNDVVDKMTSQANREKVKMNELFNILRQYVFLNNDSFENNTYSGKMRLTILDAISDHKFMSEFKIFIEQQSPTWSPELKEISAQTIKQLFLAIRSFRKLLHQDEKVKNTKELAGRETKLLG